MILSGRAGALQFSISPTIPKLSHIPHLHPWATSLALEVSAFVASTLLYCPPPSLMCHSPTV